MKTAAFPKTALVSVVTAAIITLAISLLLPHGIASIESRVGDFVWQALAPKNADPEQRVIVVDIDDASIAEYGPWPWPRPLMAQLLNALAQQGVALRILDITFPPAHTDDVALSQALSVVPTVMGQVLAFNADQPQTLGQLQGGIPDADCGQHYPQANAFIANDATLRAAATGHLTPYIDSDGAIRRLPAQICYQGHRYPTLALAALAQGFGLSADFSTQANSGWLDAPYSLVLQGLPQLRLPIDAQGNLLLSWRLPRNAMVSVSAKDVLQGRLPANTLRNRWVLMGATAFGIGDTVPTPQAEAVDGLEVHLQLLTALLDGKLPHQPQAMPYLQLLWALLSAVLLVLTAASRQRLYLPLLMGPVLMAATLAFHGYALATWQWWLPWFANNLFIALATLAMISSAYWHSRSETNRLFNNLASYLPAHAARQIARQDPVDTLSAHHESVVVLYADLRNFSAWCDQLPADQVGAILHSYYVLTHRIIQQHGGTTEEYVGDAVLAVWRGQPAKAQALQAAQALITAADALLGQETHRNTLPPLAVGIGLEQGDVLVGSFGPAKRRVHTLLGKTVTTAIHLQAMTAELAQPIVIGPNAAALWQNRLTLDSLGRFLLQDNAQSIELFVPVADNSVASDVAKY